MGILERTRHVVRADLGDLLRKAKNPESLLDTYLDELRTVLDEAESLRASESASAHVFEARLRDIVSAQQTWENKARACVKMGDEDLARIALEKKFDLNVSLHEVQQELDHRKASLQVLDSSLEALRLRMAEVSRKRREIRYRRQVLQARTELQSSLGRLEPGDDESVLADAESDLQQVESKVEAYESMEGELTERKLLSLEAQERKKRRNQEIEKVIESMKKQLSGEE